MVKLVSMFGFEPAIMILPSGTSVAVEWYNRAIVEFGKPTVENREPTAAAGSYKTGRKVG